MTWRCRHCGHEAESETSCCYEHWEEAVSDRFWSPAFLGSALLTAALIVGLVAWLTR